ncbi:hypothetical protein E4U42_003915 [Claviceps africana]|uniref:Uncharacterized protein n=1 Tax=Claviceps africana TaxID=83212 RepID=A0A8K0JC27_9HYPO|nr:hypothetical protein E4U42_003915 [Claviceps africana]
MNAVARMVARTVARTFATETKTINAVARIVARTVARTFATETKTMNAVARIVARTVVRTVARTVARTFATETKTMNAVARINRGQNRGQDRHQAPRFENGRRDSVSASAAHQARERARDLVREYEEAQRTEDVLLKQRIRYLEMEILDLQEEKNILTAQVRSLEEVNERLAEISKKYDELVNKLRNLVE